jgi:hypothetical protein
MRKLLRKIRVAGEFNLKKSIGRLFKNFINPFESRTTKPLIIHCCYHRVGTVWISRILKHIAAEFGLTFHNNRQTKSISDTDILIHFHSEVDISRLQNYVGSHMIRDPRDVIVSGYFYHLWTKEKWANIPRDRFDGKSYKEYLNALNQCDGLSVELKRTKSLIWNMANWDYNNPQFFEIRYEDIILNEEPIFRRLFQHYGFKESAIERSCKIGKKYSFDKVTGRQIGEVQTGVHLRSGSIGQWKKLFEEEHRNLFKSLYPGVLTALGYEENDDW